MHLHLRRISTLVQRVLLVLSFLALTASLFTRKAFAYTAMSLPGSLFSLTGSPPDGLSNKTDFGLNLMGGNTRSENLTFGELLSYRFPVETLQVQARYIEASANFAQSAQNWMGGMRYERKLVDRLGVYSGPSLEADRFAGIFQRYAMDLGLRRTLWWDEKTKGAIELGYRYQYENRQDGQLSSEIIRLFMEGSYAWSKTTTVVLAGEYLPNLSQTADWRANGELDISCAIDKIFALNASYALRYDNVPAGTNYVSLDRMLLTTISAKF